MNSIPTRKDVMAKVVDQLLKSSKHEGLSKNAMEQERNRLEALDGKMLVEEWKTEFPNAADTGRRLSDPVEPPGQMLTLLRAYDIRRAENEPTA